MINPLLTTFLSAAPVKAGVWFGLLALGMEPVIVLLTVYPGMLEMVGLVWFPAAQEGTMTGERETFMSTGVTLGQALLTVMVVETSALLLERSATRHEKNGSEFSRPSSPGGKQNCRNMENEQFHRDMYMVC